MNLRSLIRATVAVFSFRKPDHVSTPPLHSDPAARTRATGTYSGGSKSRRRGTPGAFRRSALVRSGQW